MSRLSVRVRPMDVALTLACVVLMHVEIPLNAKAEAGLYTSFGIVVASLPVLLRSSAPVLAYLLGFAGLFVLMTGDPPYNTMPAPVVLCAYAIAERHGLRAALVTGALSLPAVVAILQVFSPHGLFDWGTAQNLALVPLPLALGVAVHDRRCYTAVLIERAEAAERTREEEAQHRVAEERLRIARDVHDVVAHAMVTINVHAGVGAHLLERDPDQAHERLRTIKNVSGDALTDLRAMLGLLREAAPGEPAPPVQRLADLGDLRENLLAAGVDLTLDVDPAARALPASVDATCFRVVQEALTNTLKHAGPTSARVRVARGDDRVVVEVLDDGGESGSAPAPLAGTGAGHGLRGMGERLAALGGTLEAGPRPEGGWRVWASVPLGAGASPRPAPTTSGVGTPAR
ncbi:sensor histidine kinase [Nocardioides marinquilinus]|uniref:sensor histidine kinase n=1 Tax=Nocardioides marinquilinus TaxID=1210400 RepID=UPI0031EB64B6